jgi:hypothetical protein
VEDTEDDVDLFPSPIEVLRRQRDYLKQRLKEEKAELARYAEIAKGVRGGGLEELIEGVAEDVSLTEGLLATYREAIKRVRG